MILIDGAFGEGGGQILRTSLALSLVQRTPFKITNIRANRKKPGLMRQHLTAVNAAAEIGQAEVRGNETGSVSLYFAPRTVRAGQYCFSIGTAGSCTLVFQTVLPALLMADTDSELILEGGTHNPFAPSFDFLAKAFLPIINRMGAKVEVVLERPGFYPVGGGRFVAKISPAKTLLPIELTKRGDILNRIVRAMVAHLPEHIGEREIRQIQKKTRWHDTMRVEKADSARCPGNALVIEIESKHITEVFTGFGKKGVRAEQVADRTLKDALKYLDTDDVPVGKYLADQLLIPMALSGSGHIRTLSLTQHTTTNIEVIRQFMDVDISTARIEKNVWEIAVR